MDRENKYYNLIENLVKNHKKFPGYEAILDDIIDDVYAHSEVIINSIDNENVINSYLEKVITTSLITVPKRMNFNSHISHKVIHTSPEIINKPKSIIETEPKESTALPELKPEIQKANPEFVDKMINSMNNDSDKISEQEITSDDIFSEIDDVITEEDLSNTDLIEEKDFSSENIEEINETEFSEDIITFDDSSPNDEISDENIDSEELKNEEYEDDVFSLQTEENIINNEDSIEQDDSFQLIEEEENVDIEPPIEELQLVESNSDDTTDDNVIDFEEKEEKLSETSEELINSENNEILENIEESDTEYLSLDNNSENDFAENLTQEESSSDNIYDCISETESLQIDYNNIDEDVEEKENIEILSEVDNNSPIEDLSENYDDNIDTEDAIDNIELLSDGDDDFIQSDENELSDIIEESDFISETDDIELSVNNEDSYISEETEMIDDDDNSIDNDIDLNLTEDFIDEQKDREDVTFKSIDYSVFDYTPDENSISENIDSITKQLIQLDNENPELKILTIFDLKYKQKLSVNEIASELNIKEQDVINTLNKLIELV